MPLTKKKLHRYPCTLTSTIITLEKSQSYAISDLTLLLCQGTWLQIAMEILVLVLP